MLNLPVKINIYAIATSQSAPIFSRGPVVRFGYLKFYVRYNMLHEVEIS